MTEQEETFKRLARYKKKLTALKYVRRILNDEIRELEEEIDGSLSQYYKDPEKRNECEKKLREIVDEMEQDLQ